MLKLNESSTKEVKGLISTKSNVKVIVGSVAYLATKEGKTNLTEKEIREYLVALGYTYATRANGFRSTLYDMLVEGSVSEKDFNEVIADTSDNTLKNRKHFNAIRLLCNEVRSLAVANAKGGKQ